MTKTFYRALIGFIVLSSAIILLTAATLFTVKEFAPDYLWLGAVAMFFAVGIEISIYESCLADPVRNWIKEPAREVARQKLEAEQANADAKRKAGKKKNKTFTPTTPPPPPSKK